MDIRKRIGRVNFWQKALSSVPAVVIKLLISAPRTAGAAATGMCGRKNQLAKD